MERVIKFRAWLPQVGRMGMVTSIRGTNETYRPTTIVAEYLTVDGKQRFYTAYTFELMQFTGLLDKNAVQMFESDIIEANDVYGKYIGHIVWWEDRWALTYLGQDKVTPQFQSLMTVRNPIIVGNVFESPELINNEEERLKK